MAGEKVAGSNGVLDFSQLLAQLAPLFLGSGSTTQNEASTSKTSVAPEAMDATQQLLSILMPQINGTEGTDNVVNNILLKAQQAFTPILGQEAGAGLYNSTVKTQLGNELAARGVGEASAAVLQHQQQAAAAAAQVTGSLLSATKSTSTVGSTTKATAPVVNPGISGAVLAALAGKSILNQVSPKKVAALKTPKEGDFDANDQLDKDLGGYSAANSGGVEVGTGQTLDASGNLTGNASVAAGDVGVTSPLEQAGAINESLLAAPDAANLAVEGVNFGGGGGGGDITTPPGSLPELNFGGGSTANSSSLSDSTLAGETFQDGSITGGADLGVEAGEGFLTGSDAFPIAADFAGEEGIGDIAAAAASAIVCTESVRQGLLSVSLVKEENAINLIRLSQHTINGYHYLAAPLVGKMRADKRFAKKMAGYAEEYCNEVVYRKHTVRSLLFRYLGEPVCFAVGLFVGPQNWQRLYEGV